MYAGYLTANIRLGILITFRNHLKVTLVWTALPRRQFVWHVIFNTILNQDWGLKGQSPFQDPDLVSTLNQLIW